MHVVSHMRVARVFIEAVQTFWRDGVKSDNALLPVADAALGLSELPKTDTCYVCNA
jgi:hypothetical protein